LPSTVAPRVQNPGSGERRSPARARAGVEGSGRAARRRAAVSHLGVGGRRWRCFRAQSLAVRDRLRLLAFGRRRHGEPGGVAPLMEVRRPGVDRRWCAASSFWGADPNVTEVGGVLADRRFAPRSTAPCRTAFASGPRSGTGSAGRASPTGPRSAGRIEEGGLVPDLPGREDGLPRARGGDLGAVPVQPLAQPQGGAAPLRQLAAPRGAQLRAGGPAPVPRDRAGARPLPRAAQRAIGLGRAPAHPDVFRDPASRAFLREVCARLSRAARCGSSSCASAPRSSPRACLRRRLHPLPLLLGSRPRLGPLQLASTVARRRHPARVRRARRVSSTCPPAPTSRSCAGTPSPCAGARGCASPARRGRPQAGPVELAMGAHGQALRKLAARVLGVAAVGAGAALGSLGGGRAPAPRGPDAAPARALIRGPGPLRASTGAVAGVSQDRPRVVESRLVDQALLPPERPRRHPQRPRSFSDRRARVQAAMASRGIRPARRHDGSWRTRSSSPAPGPCSNARLAFLSIGPGPVGRCPCLSATFGIRGHMASSSTSGCGLLHRQLVLVVEHQAVGRYATFVTALPRPAGDGLPDRGLPAACTARSSPPS
jgi:hypothetical protein